jgi:two-component system CheB/CheR fusion protein
MAARKKKKTELQPPATLQNFPIIGIGASAGGLDAFKSLIKAIPEDSGMAYVLVQHLDPAHESILPEILQRLTEVPVLEITDDIHLAPDHIYVIPPNKMLVSTDGVLKLTDRTKRVNLSIDIFFTSLADVHKEFAVGVVLSGTGSDGTLGLKAIKEQGGISIAQDLESAGYGGMPQSAINAGVVDFILAPEKIPEQLLHINSTFRNTHVFKIEEEELPKNDEAVFKQIISLLRQRRGVDFTYYKQPTIRRRIARRIAITKKINLAGYLKFFRTDKAEQDALFQDILIPVTSFFRGPKTFQFLSKTILPTLFKSKAKEEPLRIWIAGCSTGEETYSLAIIINEYITLTKRDGLKVQLFASDISEKAILTARTGIYAKTEVEKLSGERVKKYFKKNSGSYEVNKFIRDMCVFAPQNFLKDPPFARMDLISCRNVLIYMDTFLQKKALTTFHYALKENGFLMLGNSESTSNVSELFSATDKHEKIYLRKQLQGRFIHTTMERKEEATRIKSQKVTKPEATETDFRKSAEALLLSKYTPASVVVNEQMDIVHIHGILTSFLEPPQGKPTFNLLKMANEALAFELRNALHKAKLREVAVLKENIPIKVNGKQFLVNIEIVPLTDTVDIHYLILFTKTAVPIIEEKTTTTSSRKIADALKQN